MKRLRLTTRFAVDWMLVTYLANGAVRTLCYEILSRLRLGYFYILATDIVIYLPLFLMLFKDKALAKKMMHFVALYVGVGLFFLITLAIHPNYEEYYTRDVFGAVYAVFRPDTGALFGFLGIYLCKDFKQIKKVLLIAAYVLLIYGIYQVVIARSRGYWEAYSYQGEREQLDYNLGVGYSLMFCCIMFFNSFLSDRKRWYDLVLTLIAFILVLTEGSRGAIICFVVYVVLYCFFQIKNMSLAKKLLIGVLLIGAYVILANAWTDILSWVINILSGMNIESRTIEMLLNNTLTSDNGRERIAELAWSTIEQQGFFGNGAFGSRWVIAPSYYWGYPHSIFLEFVIDYGWMIGCILLAALAFVILRALFVADDDAVAVICILLAMNVKLFLSDSYWAYSFFWALLACVVLVGASVGRRYAKRRKRTLLRMMRR